MVHCHLGNGLAVVFPKDLFLDLCCLLCMSCKLPLLISSKLFMFADDIKLHRTIRSPKYCLIQQRDINVLLEWSKYRLLSFNVTKCKVVHIGSVLYVGNCCLNETQ